MDSPTLHILDGADEGQSLDLHKSPFTVGRAKGLDRTLRDETVSRQHARFFERDGAWHVVDLHSTHGTFVNEQKITRQEIRSGDEIRLGKTRMRFQVAGAGEPGPGPFQVAGAAVRSGLTETGEDPFADDPPAGPASRDPLPPAAAPVAARPQPTAAYKGGAGSLYRADRAARVARTHRAFFWQDLDQHPVWVRLGAAVLAVAVALSLGYGAMRLIRGSGVSDQAPSLEEQEHQGPNRPQRRPR